MKKIKLPFALENNRIVHISKVERGLACECYCPSCESTLVAKKGEKNSPHFSHYKAEDCVYGLETALHKIAKQILEE